MAMLIAWSPIREYTLFDGDSPATQTVNSGELKMKAKLLQY